MDDEQFLNWVADRLVKVLNDATENTDYVLALRGLAKKQRDYKEQSHKAFGHSCTLYNWLAETTDAARMFYGES